MYFYLYTFKSYVYYFCCHNFHVKCKHMYWKEVKAVMLTQLYSFWRSRVSLIFNRQSYLATPWFPHCWKYKHKYWKEVKAVMLTQLYSFWRCKSHFQQMILPCHSVIPSLLHRQLHYTQPPDLPLHSHWSVLLLCLGQGHRQGAFCEHELLWSLSSGVELAHLPWSESKTCYCLWKITKQRFREQLENLCYVITDITIS